MIAAFIFFSHSALILNHSLIPPHISTNLSEISEWSIRGSAVNMKKFIRLTDDVTNDFGGICHRVPTNFREWAMEIEMDIHDGNSGDGFIFSYTMECCPNLLKNPVTGIVFWFNTTESNEEELSPIYFWNGLTTLINYSSRTDVGRYKLRNLPNPVKIGFTLLNSEIRLTINGESVFNSALTDIPAFGYYSLSAFTKLKADNHDLICIRTSALSEITPTYDYDFSSINRKLIVSSLYERRKMKNVRREKMVTVNKYNQEKQYYENNLQQSKQEIGDSIKIIKETKFRTHESVTLEKLQRFVDESITSTINKAEDKVKYAAEKFDETRLDLNDVWSYLMTELEELKRETNLTMTEIGNEAIEIARNIKLGKDRQVMKKEISKGIKEQREQSTTAKILAIIAAFEILGYIVFFVIKHRKTHGFKKID